LPPAAAEEVDEDLETEDGKYTDILHPLLCFLRRTFPINVFPHYYFLPSFPCRSKSCKGNDVRVFFSHSMDRIPVESSSSSGLPLLLPIFMSEGKELMPQLHLEMKEEAHRHGLAPTASLPFSLSIPDLFLFLAGKDK